MIFENFDHDLVHLLFFITLSFFNLLSFILSFCIITDNILLIFRTLASVFKTKKNSHTNHSQRGTYYLHSMDTLSKTNFFHTLT